eukprot:evm.model.scf_3072.1 EVM.evm.TU.scf_3072.1   scf_3072:5480-10677(+)
MAYGTEGGPECTARGAACQVLGTGVCAKGGQAENQMDCPAYGTDEFRMYCFKVTPCAKTFSHDWTLCPFAHPGEKARRRDPLRCSYAAIACIDMKKNGTCPRGDCCPYAHNVFEYWMHPTRYRTQICKDGPNCDRSICFFAHRLEELRVPPHKPGFPPECRRRRRNRCGTAGTAGQAGQVPAPGPGAQPLPRRALSVPTVLGGDGAGFEGMQMSDGARGSPGRRVPKVSPVSCPAALDPFASSPITPLSPTIWSPRLPMTPLAQTGASPVSARDPRRWSLDSAPITRQSSDDVTQALLQLIDSLSLSARSNGGATDPVSGMSSNTRSRSLDSLQTNALRLAAVERALGTGEALEAHSARSSVEDYSPHWGQAPGCNPQLGMADGAALAGLQVCQADLELDSNQLAQGCGAPFPAMSRDVAVQPGLLLEGWSSGESFDCTLADALPQGYELCNQISAVSM